MGYLGQRIDQLGDEARELGSVGEHLQRQNELLEVIAKEAVGGPDSYVDTSDDSPESRGSGQYSAFAGISVTDEEQVINWNFMADAVAVKGFDQPILVAFKSGDSDARWIDLRPDKDDGFSIGGDVSLDTGRCFFQLAPNATAETQITIIALKDK